MVLPSTLPILKSLSLLIWLSLLLGSCSTQTSEAGIQNMMVCQQNNIYQCDRSTLLFQTATAELMTTADISAVPVGTPITVEWKYLSGELDKEARIQRTNYIRASERITIMFATLSPPSSGWPEGKYEVTLFANDNPNAVVRQSFSIVLSDITQ